MRLGIADHFGWATAVVASDDHQVVARRRLELVDPSLPAAPIHHVGGPHDLHRPGRPLDDEGLAELVATVRDSVAHCASTALAELESVVPGPIVSMSLRAWAAEFPDDIATQRRVPYESRADSIMYRRGLAEAGAARGWHVHLYDPRRVEDDALGLLGQLSDEVLRRPRTTLGPPWSKDHRMALAATIVASGGGG
jgi:hypothetical protein